MANAPVAEINCEDLTAKTPREEGLITKTENAGNRSPEPAIGLLSQGQLSFPLGVVVSWRLNHSSQSPR